MSDENMRDLGVKNIKFKRRQAKLCWYGHILTMDVSSIHRILVQTCFSAFPVLGCSHLELLRGTLTNKS